MENTPTQKITKQIRLCLTCKDNESTVIKVEPGVVELVGWYCPTCKQFKKE